MTDAKVFRRAKESSVAQNPVKTFQVLIAIRTAFRVRRISHEKKHSEVTVLIALENWEAVWAGCCQGTAQRTKKASHQTSCRTAIGCRKSSAANPTRIHHTTVCRDDLTQQVESSPVRPRGHRILCRRERHPGFASAVATGAVGAFTVKTAYRSGGSYHPKRVT